MPQGDGGNRQGQNSEEAPRDESEPSPRAESPPLNAQETVAPDVPQSELVLRKLEDLIKNDKVTPELEKATGMSREEMEQFVEQYRKVPRGPAGEGREIEVDPNEKKRSTAQPKLSELKTTAPVRAQTVRERGASVDDQDHGNVEGTRFVVPPEIRSRYEAYKSSVLRSPSVQPARPAPASGSGGR